MIGRGFASAAVLHIARASIAECLQSRLILAWIALASTGAASLIFTASLAVIEAGDTALAITAPLLRIGAVALTATFVAAAACRELSGRGIELVLAAPIARSTWVVGRLIGAIVLGVATALVTTLPLAAIAQPATLVAWTVTLALELCLAGGFALLAAIALLRLPLALLALGGFYVCARSMATIRLLADRSPAIDADAASSLASGVLELIAIAMPRLDLFADTGWLLGSSIAPGTWQAVSPAVAQSAGWLVVILAVGVLDFERRRD